MTALARAAALLGALLLAAPLARAAEPRTSATLRVLVLDPSGAAIPGAFVSVEAGEEAREAAADRGGAVRFDVLPLGPVVVRAELSGFEPAQKAHSLRDGKNEIELTLPLARRSEEVAVRPDERASASQGFGSVLTAAEIAALPDDPEELDDALRRMAGPDAVLRVNGFSGGRLPPKSQIRQIRFQMNPYSAEYHEAGHPRVDILTKPGMGSWRTGFKSGFRDANLNARPPLAPEQPADDYARYGMSLLGPLWKGRTSLSLDVDGRSNDGARTINGTAPSGAFSELAPQTSDKLDVLARLEHAAGASHTLRAEYQRLRHDQEGLAASGLDLPERGYGQGDVEHLLRFSDSGAIGKRAATETLLELRLASTRYRPVSIAPAVQVLGAFGAGGAQIAGERRTTSLTLTQNLDFGTKRHSFRTGLRLELERDQDSVQRNAQGTFTFPSLADYEAGRPSLFRRQAGDPRVSFGHVQAGLYFQDEIRLSRKATLSLGLRNEAQSAVAGALHLEPRAGLAYALDGRTTLRVGAGIFGEWFASAARAETIRLDGRHSIDAAVEDPSYPEPPTIAGPESPVASRYLEVASLGLPRVGRVSAGIERNHKEAVRLRLDYSFERGSGLLRTLNRNAPLPDGGRPDPRRGNLLDVVSEGRSRRHTLNASGGYLKPGARASAFLGYTFTSSRNDGDLATVPTTAAGLNGEWGPAANDIRHRVFGFGRARVGKRLSASSLMRFESGAPYNVTTGFDDNGDAIVNDRPAGVSRNVARGASRFNLDVRLAWSKGFGPARQPSGPTAQILRIGDGEGPPDMPGPEANRRFQVSVYAQAFNATNHTNPRAYFGVMTSPDFGQPLLAEPGRRIELGASFGF